MSVIQLYSGTMFDLAAPDPSLISVTDIAHSLARLCRYTGHASRFYSVAEHSVHTSRIVETWSFVGESYVKEALLHDAAEAFIGDVSSPLKSLLPDYRKLDEKMHGVIAQRFGLRQEAGKWPAPVRDADLRMLGIEARALMQPTLVDAVPHWRFVLDVEMHEAVDRIGRTPEQAERMFLDRCEELGVR